MTGGPSDDTLSRLLSHALRHEPWRYELELDDAGWVDLEELVAAVRAQGEGWHEVGTEDVRRVVDGAGGGRHELLDGRIRARYGHSLPALVDLPATPPPATLHHGTTRAAVAAVLREGLSSRGRQYVHLSPSRARAREVGRRRDADPVVLDVRAADAARAGVRFHRATDAVWLSDAIPPAYLRVPGDPPADPRISSPSR